LNGPKYLYDLLTHFWPLTNLAFRMGRRPIVGAVVRPFFSPRHHRATVIPVNEAIPRGDNTPLPYDLLTPLVEQASQRFIMHGCVCRQGGNCQHYPQDLGCLYLGDGAARINPRLGRLASAAETLGHLERTLQAGLTPMVVHTAFDAYLLGIDYRRMLTVCFCCDCCCAVRQGLRYAPPDFRAIVQPLPGLQVAFGRGCIECGACQEVCYVNAITLPSADHGQGVIAESCLGCGRCAQVCPVGAIELRLTARAETQRQLQERFAQRTQIGS
jgi:UDP-glucose 4-epimerase